eukprot:5418898-Prymnesium_polylepis.1
MGPTTPYASYEPIRTAPNTRGDTVQHFCPVFEIPVESGAPSAPRGRTLDGLDAWTLISYSVGHVPY